MSSNLTSATIYLDGVISTHGRAVREVLVKSGSGCHISVSYNGSTTVSKTVYLGSNPSTGAGRSSRVRAAYQQEASILICSISVKVRTPPNRLIAQLGEQ